jgi:hypothetical protein
MSRILIIGDRESADVALPDNASPSEFGKIYELQLRYARERRLHSYNHVIRCRDSRDLCDTVSTLARESGQMVDVLDIFDHGAPGHMRLGRDVLFQYDGESLIGGDVVKSLSSAMRQDACIRLLGCKTAKDERGRRLLTRLARTVDFSLRVYGTIERVRPVHFKDPGFLGKEDLLFGSEAATDQAAPDSDVRVTNLQGS